MSLGGPQMLKRIFKKWWNEKVRAGSDDVCDHEKITSMDTEEGNSVEKSLKTQ
jgi:hypothetical protein